MKKILLTSSLAVAIHSAPILAQDNVGTATDTFIGIMRGTGGVVEFAERIESGNSIEYRGIEITDPLGEVVFRTDWLKAMETNTPGQVLFTVAPVIEAEITDGKSVLPITLTTENMTIVADAIISGAENAASHNYVVSAPSLKVIAGAPDHEFVRNIAVDLSGFTFALNRVLEQNRFQGSISSGPLAIGLDITDEMGTSTISKSSGSNFNIAFGFDLVTDEIDALGYLSGEKGAFMNMDFGASKGATQMIIDGAKIDYSAEADGGQFTLSMMDGLFRMLIDFGNAVYQINSVGMVPLPPFEVSGERILNEIVVPTKNTGEFAPAIVKYELRNLEVSESLLGMFDPQQAIPRGPISLDIDLDASVKVNADWSDPESTFEADNPFELAEVDHVNINSILLSAAGAEVTADGRVQIDNSGPIPMPNGTATVVARGVQQLTNALVQLGFIEQMQAGMVMGMIMSFGRPGENPDEFISDLEFSPAGLTANGVPVPF